MAFPGVWDPASVPAISVYAIQAWRQGAVIWDPRQGIFVPNIVASGQAVNYVYPVGEGSLRAYFPPGYVPGFGKPGPVPLL